MLQRRAWKIISFTIQVALVACGPASRFIYLRCILFNERQQQGRGRRGGGGALSRADEGASRMGIAPGHIIVSLGRAAAGGADGRHFRHITFCLLPASQPFSLRLHARSLAAAALFLARTRPLPLVGVYNEMGGWLAGRSVGRSVRCRSARFEMRCAVGTGRFLVCRFFIETCPKYTAIVPARAVYASRHYRLFRFPLFDESDCL
jgi:hypothetical protein